MPRPFDNEYPENRCICMVCGAAFGFAVDLDEGGAYREFLSEHRLCRLVGMPSSECLVDDCRSTAIGPAQRCPAHGGTRKGVVDRRALHGK